MTKSEEAYLQRMARDVVSARMYHNFCGESVESERYKAALEEYTKKARRAVSSYERGLITKQEAIIELITIGEVA